MRDHNWVRVVAIAAGVAILLLLLGPTTVHPDPVDRGTAGRSILAGVAPAGVRARAPRGCSGQRGKVGERGEDAAHCGN